MPPGTYRVIAKLGEAMTEADVTVTADAVAAPELNLTAGRVIISPRIYATAPVSDGAAVRVTLPDGRETTYYGLADMVLPAGDLPVTVTIENASVTQVVPVLAGTTLELDIIAAAGLAAVQAFYAPGVMVDGGARSVVIYPAKTALDGSREKLDTKYGAGAQFTLPPGDYVVEVGLDAALVKMPFTVQANARNDVAVILNAGVAAIAADGATQIDILPAKAKLDGSRERISYAYAPEFTYTLPAGDYAAVATRGDVTGPEVPFTVVAAKRTDVVVP